MNGEAAPASTGAVFSFTLLRLPHFGRKARY
jgi:hypothetical protein